MKCPICKIDHDRVLDTRASDDGFAIRRRRVCLACKRRFTTYERVEAPVKVVKKDGTRAPYDRNKLKEGLEKACWKRPISDRQIEEILSKIESDVEGTFDTEVESRYLGELAIEQLRDLDQVAYVRFASVYRQFEDVHDFVDELNAMSLHPDRRKAASNPTNREE